MRPHSHYLAAVKAERVQVKYNLAGTTPSAPRRLRAIPFEGAEAPKTEAYRRLLRTLEKMLKAKTGEVALAPGCSQALTVTLAAITSPGDSVLIETPTYEPFLATAKFLGLKIRRVKRTGKRQQDLKEISRKSAGAKVILLANPSCPSGHLFSRADLNKLANLGPALVVDEIYLPLFDGGRLSRLSHPKAIHISGLSKTVGLSSARVGWVRAPKRTIEAINRVATLFHIDMPTASLQIADRALSKWRKLLQPSLNKIRINSLAVPGLPVVTPPDGSYFNLIIPKRFSSGHQFADALKKKSVWVRAGEWFESPRTVRVSLLADPTAFKKACAIMRKFYHW